MKISIPTIVTVTAITSPLQAQSAWTLRQCAEYAVEHNLQIKQQDNQRRQQELQLSTARNARLPEVSGSLGQNFSFGRGLTAENTYTNTNTSNTSFSLSTSIPLFTGFQIPNQIKLNQLNLEAATQDLEKAKNDIRMQVAQAYVQILYDMEIADVARRQIAIDSGQVARLHAGSTTGSIRQKWKGIRGRIVTTTCHTGQQSSYGHTSSQQLTAVNTHHDTTAGTTIT